MKRREAMRQVMLRGRRAFRASQLGETLPVIFETVDAAGVAHGWSDNYLAVRLPAEQTRLGAIVSVAATEETLADDADF